MKKHMKTFLPQLKLVIKNILEHFNDSPISTIFFVIIFCIFLLNVIRKIFIWQEKKSKSQNQRCKYLINLGSEQDCDIPSQREQFKARGNSCADCRRKLFEMTDSEAENRIAMGCMWKYEIILLAGYSKNALPYISIFYTLAVAIFEKNK